MESTAKHGILYPGTVDLVQGATDQFRRMAESIDRNIDDLPDEVTSLVQQAQDKAQQAATDAQTYAANTRTLQDQAVAGLLADTGSQTYRTLNPERHMVVFGDSMTESASGTDKQWWSIVAGELGMTAHKYGAGGTGFLNMATTGGYAGQLDRAEADTGYDHGQVALVFCNGSTNDWWDPSLAGKVDDWCARARSMYPNAAFVGFSGLCAANVRHRDNSARMTDYAGIFNTVAQRMHLAGFHVFTNAHLWLLYNFDLSQEDTLHPNDRGHRAIADYVLAGLRDGVWCPVPSCMGATATSSDEIGGDCAQLDMPYRNSPRPSSSYFNRNPDPVSHLWHFNFQSVRVGLNHDEIARFARARKDGPDGTPTAVYGLDMPICVKPYPMRRNGTHEDIEYATGFKWSVNGVEQDGPATLYCKTTDSRLDTPTDAKYYLWLRFNNVYYRVADGSMQPYELLGSGTISADDPSKTMPIGISGRISAPICGYFQH